MEKNPDTIFIVSDEVAKQINDPTKVKKLVIRLFK